MATQSTMVKITKNDLKDLSQLVSIRWASSSSVLIELPPDYYRFRFESTWAEGDDWYGDSVRKCPHCDGSECERCEWSGVIYDDDDGPGAHNIDTKVPLPWIYIRADFNPLSRWDPIAGRHIPGQFSAHLPWIRVARRRIGKLTDNFYRAPLPNIYGGDRMCFDVSYGDETPTLAAALNSSLTTMWDTWYNYDNFKRLEDNGLWRYLMKQAKSKYTYDMTKIVKSWAKMTPEEFLKIPKEHWYYAKKVEDSIKDGRKKRTLIKAG